MKIHEFQRVAQQDGQLRVGSTDGEVKLASLKGRAVSYRKGETNQRNQDVKNLFLKAIKDAYGDKAEDRAKSFIDIQPGALTSKVVRQVLNEVTPIHRTHGEIKGLKNTGPEQYEDTVLLQKGDLSRILKRSLDGENNLSRSIASLEVGSPLLNKIVMSSDRRIAEIIHDLYPQITEYDLSDAVSIIRESTPRLELSEDGSIESATIGETEYEHVRKLGKGGFGEVHLMRSKPGQGIETESLVVKKIITSDNPDPQELRGKRKEAQHEVRVHDFALSEGLDVTNIAKIKTAMNNSDGTISIALEACELGDIRGLVGQGATGGAPGKIDSMVEQGTITLDDSKKLKMLICRDLLNGMKVIQRDCNMMHLDMKPDNVFLSADGVVKIGDFGVAIESTSKDFDDLVTTEDYAAPELKVYDRGVGKASTNSDSYSVGVILLELHTNLRPFFGDHLHSFEAANARTAWFGEDRHTGLAQGKYATGNQRIDDLVNALTHPNPEKRISMEEALSMDYFIDLPAQESEEMSVLRQKLAEVASA